MYIDIFSIHYIIHSYVYIYITLGTNNVYKNINLGRQTLNYKSLTLGYSRM